VPSAISLPRRVVALFALTAASVACSPRESPATRDSASWLVTSTLSAPPKPVALSRERAIRNARDFLARSPVAAQVYLDSVDVAEGEATWHVMFRRRAIMMPAVVTVDVDRRTGAMRFPGDE
jgi:hypothetical protein